MLEGKPVPESLEYLLKWLGELHGRSGIGMSGYTPLTYATIGEWSRLTGSVPDNEELQALFILDAFKLNPGDPEKEDG
jgi:hypothetical protein